MSQYINKEIVQKEIFRRIHSIPETDEKLWKTVYGNEIYSLVKLSDFMDDLEILPEPEPIKRISIINRDGEKWVRVCALGEDFLISSHDYMKNGISVFNWSEAHEIGTFTKKQGLIILTMLDDINAILNEIGDDLQYYHWCSSDPFAISFTTTAMDSYQRTHKFAVRQVISLK